MGVYTYSQGEEVSAALLNAYSTNSGLVYVGGGSFTTAANPDFDNVFSATYDHYRIYLNLTAISTNVEVYFRYIDNTGSVVTTTNYDYQLFENVSTTLTGASTMGATASRIQYTYTTPGYMAATIDLFSPFQALQTLAISTATSPNGTTNILSNDLKHRFRLTTQMRGIRFLPGGGATITGSAKIFGVRQA